MKASHYREKFREMMGSPAGEDAARHLCSRTALSFLDRYYYNDEFAEEYITLLCEMATSSSVPMMSAASSALFGLVIESLCDDFEELQTEAYNRVMSMVIEFCRSIPEGAGMDARLKDFGLDSADKIYTRVESLRHDAIRRRDISRARRFVVLSRVTIGADVAVTSTLIQRLMHSRPGAEIVLVGDTKLKSIFGGNAGLRFRTLSYSRRGGLVERVSKWHDVLDVVSEERRGFAPGECVLVDTDSRLSQLGVLPIVEDSDYIFFRSRGDSEVFPRKLSMAELANAWADKVLGESPFAYPKLWLQKETVRRGEAMVGCLRKAGAGKIVFVNFGVGGNPRKRVDGNFETLLLKKLLCEDGVVVILDKGTGAEELARSDATIAKLRDEGIPAADTAFASGNFPGGFKHGVLGVVAEIGEAASLIAASDLYVGYDSACQHMAAAAGVRTVTVFAGTNNTRFVRRWRAFGPAKSDLVHVDTLGRASFFDANDIVERVAEVAAG